jgi:hypothetical protein
LHESHELRPGSVAFELDDLEHLLELGDPSCSGLEVGGEWLHPVGSLTELRQTDADVGQDRLGVEGAGGQLLLTSRGLAELLLQQGGSLRVRRVLGGVGSDAPEGGLELRDADRESAGVSPGCGRSIGSGAVRGGAETGGQLLDLRFQGP